MTPLAPGRGGELMAAEAESAGLASRGGGGPPARFGHAIQPQALDGAEGVLQAPSLQLAGHRRRSTASQFRRPRPPREAVPRPCGARPVCRAGSP